MIENEKLQQHDRIYRATIVNPQSPTEGQYFPDGMLVVSATGRIIELGATEDLHPRYPSLAILDFSDCIIIPGLFDCHTHLPQYYASGAASATLLDWLRELIFPLEAKFSDEEFALQASSDFFNEVRRCGTTSVVVNTSSFAQAADLSFQVARDSGMRVWMGATMMDSSVPQELLQTTQQNHDVTKMLFERWHGIDESRIQYILTPRFAGSCSSDLLRGTANFARQNDLFVQTHLAESHAELLLINELFPEALDYTDVYDRAGLLSDQTLLAHCIHLSERELRTIRQKGCGVVHCPTSNRYLASGTMPLTDYIAREIPVALGTDVAAGYSLSVLREAREAIETTKQRSLLNNRDNTLNPGEALYMATLGAATTMKVHSLCGNLDAKKEADFVVLDAKNVLSPAVDRRDAKAVLHKMLYSSAEVLGSYVRGKEIYQSPEFQKKLNQTEI